MLQLVATDRKKITNERGYQMNIYTSYTQGSGGDFSVGQAEMNLDGLTYRWEGDKWREYLWGRPVITREEMKHMDPPCPPEDDEDLDD